jgi:Domain of unknown function (DUF4394)/PEP-CTERM motif
MKLLLASAFALAAIAAPAQAAKFYAVDEVNNLVTFNSNAPGMILSSVALQGVTGSSLLAMDYRVRDGIIYGHTDDGRIIKINPTTGATTTFATVSVTGTNFTFDFNPTNANLRIVSNDDTNYVYNFVTNALVPGPNVAYGAGPLMGANPDITAGAYTFNDNNPMTGTTLFVIDSRNNALATQNAATGVLTYVGDLGQPVGARTSFDIVTHSGQNFGFVQSADRFLKVNLGTGMLTEIGQTDRSLFALTAAVPEPASWAMMIGGFGLVGAASRRNRAAMARAVAA